MIVETKKRKAEIAKEKLEMSELTAKLDSNLKELMPLIGKIKKDGTKAKPVTDDYDRITREMIFEPRGTVADKLLTEEQLAQKEKEKLENLEYERQARMRDEVQTDNKPSHRSADALDECFFADDEDIEDDKTLRYTLDGKSKFECCSYLTVGNYTYCN